MSALKKNKVMTVTGGSSGELSCRIPTGKKVESFESSNFNSISPVSKKALNQT